MRLRGLLSGQRRLSTTLGASHVLDLPDEAWFDIELMHKDIRLALQAADELHLPMLSAQAADEVLSWADWLGYSHRDIAALREVLAKKSDVK